MLAGTFFISLITSLLSASIKEPSFLLLLFLKMLRHATAAKRHLLVL